MLPCRMSSPAAANFDQQIWFHCNLIIAELKVFCRGSNMLEFKSSPLILFYFSFADGHREEHSVSGGAFRQCFFNLSPNTQYKISVYTQLQSMEGPAVTITDTTRK